MLNCRHPRRRTSTLITVLARLDEHNGNPMTAAQCGRAAGIGRIRVRIALARLRVAGLVTVDRHPGRQALYQRTIRPGPGWTYACERCGQHPAAVEQHDSGTDRVLCWTCVGFGRGSEYHRLMIGGLPPEPEEAMWGRPVIAVWPPQLQAPRG
jgi:hypothetical protein